MIHIDFPFHFDGRGRTALTDGPDHILQMIEQLLFTSPGERVNRPDFGTGILRLVFDVNSPEVAAALNFTLQAALQRYLGDLVEIQGLQVTSEDSTLRVQLPYKVRRTGEQRTATLERSAVR